MFAAQAPRAWAASFVEDATNLRHRPDGMCRRVTVLRTGTAGQERGSGKVFQNVPVLRQGHQAIDAQHLDFLVAGVD